MKHTLIALTMMLSMPLWADTFNFGECSGSGTFKQQIHQFQTYEDAVTVGEIPAGIKGLHVELLSDNDVDIRLYGHNSAGTEDKIVHWPYGLLKRSFLESKFYDGTSITYSGYNGVDDQNGHEYVEVNGTTPVPMTMKAFGYKSGFATVNYSWTGKDGCTPDTNGTGHFVQDIVKEASSIVGTIPAGINDVEITLDSDKDLDIQLYGVDGIAIVSWKPTGLLAGATEQSIDYHGMHIIWSGYDGVNGQKGHEYIKITNMTTEVLTMKVYGYESGNANVDYSWGGGSKNTNDLSAVFSAGSDTVMFLRKDGAVVEFNKQNDTGTFIKHVSTTEEFFMIAPYVDKITAAFTWGQKRYYFLNDGNYIRQNPSTGTLQDPKSTASHWPGISSSYANKITAALMSTTKTNIVYIFLSDGQYLRYNLDIDAVDEGYPKNTGIYWPGLENYSKDIVSAIDYGNGKVYFFLKNKTYLRFDVSNNAIDSGYPKSNDSSWSHTFSEMEPRESIHAKASWKDVNGNVSVLRTDGFLIQNADSESPVKTLVRDTIPTLARYWGKIVGAYGDLVGYTYFFMNDGRYIKMDTATQNISGYPRNITSDNWAGLDASKYDIASVLHWNSKVLYFFLTAGDYIKYNLETDETYAGYPKEITSATWPGIGAYDTKITASVSKGDSAHIFAGNDYIDYSISKDKVTSIKPIEESIWKDIVPAPTTKFTINPFLQLPSSSSMTVRFETESITTKAEVYYKEHGTSTYSVMNAVRDSSSSRFMYATINNLKANHRYDYYVKNIDTMNDGELVTPEYHFTTYPTGLEAKKKFHLLALSDTQNNGTIGILEDIANGVAEYHCGTMDECDQKLRGITISGDVVDYGASLSQWRDDFFGQLKKITPYVPLIPAPGNHDYRADGELKTYRKMFMLPANGFEERYYELKIGNLEILSLDSYKISMKHGSYSEEFRLAQHAWLKSKLNTYKKDPTVDVVLSIFHHGCLSSLWTDGESEGSCDNVSALEDFTKESGKKSGHLFGHTHAYSKGYSRDTDHLWLNTASASGHIETLNDAYTRSKTKDYDIFSVSSSQFGFTIITINGEKAGEMSLKRYKGTMTYRANGYARLSPVYDENYDFLNIKESQISAPYATYGSKTFSSVANGALDISVDDTSKVNEVQWQLCTSDDFAKTTTVNVWGNMTRKKNIWYQNNDTFSGIDINTQKDANIFKLALNTVDGKHFEQDEQRKWAKGSEMTSHVSDYSPYNNGDMPVTIKFSSGNTYYWRARVRDAHMNWSEWSTPGEFHIQ